MANRTFLYGVHKGLGAKIIEFAGWEMPVEYEGIKEEHLAVRNSSGVFDISHMGEIEIRGPEATSLCQWVFTNDISKIKEFQAQYNLICTPEGGVIDDIIVYKFSDYRYFVCVNAVNDTRDFEWIRDEGKKRFKAEVIHRSPEFSQIAVQGPGSQEIVTGVIGEEAKDIKRFYFKEIRWNDIPLIVARTGYTGEDGFEVFLPWNSSRALWEEIFRMRETQGIKPCGLGSRDTLRIEASYPLYRHEIDEGTNPLEAGLEKFVKLDKGNFIGGEVLSKVKQEGVKKKLVGFEMIEPGIPRQGYIVLKEGAPVGKVTSGTMCPGLEKPIGMGYVKSGLANPGQEVEIEIRKKGRRAKVVGLPFLRKIRITKGGIEW